MSHAGVLFNQENKLRIRKAIKVAESRTSGEIRVFMEDRCRGELFDRAAYVFSTLKMHETKERNGVLLYIALDDRKFAVIGDVGINMVVNEHFWDEIKFEVISHFASDDIVTGLEEGIRMAGEALSSYFPHQRDDQNELADDIVIG